MGLLLLVPRLLLDDKLSYFSNALHDWCFSLNRMTRAVSVSQKLNLKEFGASLDDFSVLSKMLMDLVVHANQLLRVLRRQNLCLGSGFKVPGVFERIAGSPVPYLGWVEAIDLCMQYRHLFAVSIVQDAVRSTLNSGIYVFHSPEDNSDSLRDATLI